MKRISWILIWALKILKVSTLIGSICAKYLTFDLKQSTEELSFTTLKSDAKFEKKTDLWFEKRHEKFGKFGKFLPEHSKASKLGFDGILLSKIENVWA